jgi:sec-independent protein translocase protein TatB
MFDIDSGKLLIVAILALVVIGPKELPRVLRQVGQAVGKLRRMATEFQGQFMDAMKEADIADIRKELDELNKSAALDVAFDPVRDIRSELTSAMDGPAVTAASSTSSPAQGFELPALPETEAELGGASTGIGSLAEAAPAASLNHDVAVLEEAPSTFPDLEGAAVDLGTVRAKRRIPIRRRTSRLNSLQPESVAQRTGEPLLIRRCIVRPKSRAPENVPTA